MPPLRGFRNRLETRPCSPRQFGLSYRTLRPITSVPGFVDHNGVGRADRAPHATAPRVSSGDRAMTAGRRLGLVLTVLLGLSGCRAAGTGSLSLHPRPHAPTTGSLDVQEF